MNTQTEIPANLPVLGFIGSIDDSGPEFELKLRVSDPEVLAELRKHPAGAMRNDFALAALRLGVLSLRQAAGEVDANAIKRAAQDMLSSFSELMTKSGSQITSTIASALRQYFDPSTGALPQRIESLIKSDGELDRALRIHLAPGQSTITKTLSEHFGEASPIAKLLSPTDANGVKAQVEAAIRNALKQQQEQILGEFSLDDKESALSRLVAELTSCNGALRSNLQEEVAKLADEFSLDKPDSALSRLVGRVESAHRAITDQFSSDNEDSAMLRLSRMLQQTSAQIDKNLTLDDDTSALYRLKRELEGTLDSIAKSNNEFQNEVRSTLAALQARKQEAARSTRHGSEFESELGNLLAAEASRLSDPFESVGPKTGVMKNCKAGDFVTTLSAESSSAGARIVWEAKEDASYDLKDALTEISVARSNRQAQIGIFVFSSKTAPKSIPPFARYGNDIVVVWDVENAESDLNIRVAYSLARALVVRETSDSVESTQALKAIEVSTRAIEKQIEHLDQIKTWAETARSSGEKVIDRATRMRSDLAREVESLDRQVNGLKTMGAKAA